MYYTYMLRCTDGSIYTGITNNIDKRYYRIKELKNNGAKIKQIIYRVHK